MKKVLLLIVLICESSLCVMAQISIREIANSEEVKSGITFDSTVYYNYKTEAYIGQKVLIKPSLSSLEAHRFINLPGTAEFDITPYYNKVLIVTGVSDYNFRKFYDFDYWDKPALVLSDPENDAPICMMAHNSRKSTYYPIIPLSFYNYLKREFLNKRVYVCPYCINTHDINTGKIIPDIEAKKWTCVDIQFRKRDYDNGYEMCLFLRSEEGYESDIEVSYLDRLWHGDGRKRIFSNKEWIKYGKKYGYDTMRTVLKGKIQIGMHIELLKMAWGFPDRINELSSNISQYVYYDQYVYLEWQNDNDAYIIEYN